MANELSGLPEWVNAIASHLEPNKVKEAHRTIARRLRAENRKRTHNQQDADGNDFIRPLQRKNDPMFREITALRYLKAKGNYNSAKVGFIRGVGRVAKVHQHGELSEVRPGSRKYPYPQRTLIGINEDDQEMILQILREMLISD